jgi:hypothetical protein
VDGDVAAVWVDPAEDAGRDTEDPPRCRRPPNTFARDDPVVLLEHQLGDGNVLVGPQEEPLAWWGRVAGTQDAGCDPPERRLGAQPDLVGAGAVSVEMPEDVFGDDGAVEGGDVGGVDGMQRVADGEDPRQVGAQRGVDERALARGVERDPGSAGELVVGDLVAGEDDGVALDGASFPGVEVLDLHGLDVGSPDDLGEPGAGGDLGAKRDPAQRYARRVPGRSRRLRGLGGRVRLTGSRHLRHEPGA